MSREWYRFFLNIFTLVGGGNNQTSLDDLQLAPPFVPATAGGGSGTVTSVDVSGGTTGLTTSGGPITTSGTITLAGILNIANGGTGSATAAGAPFALKGANADITSLSGLTGAISSPTYVQFGSGSGTTLTAGRMWYDQTTGSLNFGMGGGNITQQVGEETFMYGKASAAITDSPLQIIYHTGTVGASGVITFAPTIAGITNVNDIIGVATESLALNDFGRITAFGVVRGITTNGTAFGETWADDDVIWYNPVTGNPTKVEPVAPNIKVQIGTVINAGSGGSGSFQVLLRPGSVLGGTDSNVQFGTLANNNLIAYDSTLGYWKNVTSSSLGLGTVTSVSVVSANGFAGTVATATTTPAITVSTSITGVIKGNGTAISAATVGTDYSVGTSALTTGILKSTTTTGALSIAVAADFPTLNQNTTGSAATLTTPRAIYGNNFDGSAALTQIIASTYGGTGNGFTKFSGATTAEKTYSLPDVTTTILTTNAAVTIGQGGTGQTTAGAAFNALSPITTTGDLIIGNGANSATRLAIGANNYVLTSNGTTATWAVASGSGATISNDTTTATNVYPTFAAATSGSLATIYTGDTKLLYKPSTGEFTSSIHISSNGIQVNSKTVSTSYTIATGNSGMSAGPITIASGQTVTVASGSRWVVL
jgi:hypothetical protein